MASLIHLSEKCWPAGLGTMEEVNGTLGALTSKALVARFRRLVKKHKFWSEAVSSIELAV